MDTDIIGSMDTSKSIWCSRNVSADIQNLGSEVHIHPYFTLRTSLVAGV